MLRSQEVFEFSNALALDAVSQLKGDVVLQLSTMFAEGSLSALRDWLDASQTSGPLLDQLQLDPEQLLRKMRLCTLALLCSKHESLTFEQLSQHLAVAVTEIEPWLIDGMFDSFLLLLWLLLLLFL
jgi:hypothetical protein